MSRTETASISVQNPSKSTSSSASNATVKTKATPVAGEAAAAITAAPETKNVDVKPSESNEDESEGVAERDDSEKPLPSSTTIDMEQFNQILELDAEGEYEFSASMVGAYFDQARSTFEEMSAALDSKDLTKLSELGHFLKGSSAQLGVSRVQSECEKIQHYGVMRDQENNVDLTDVQALKMISDLMDTVRTEYDSAEVWLKNYFQEKGVDIEELM